VNCPPFPISLSFWVELVGACNSIRMIYFSVLYSLMGNYEQALRRNDVRAIVLIGSDWFWIILYPYMCSTHTLWSAFFQFT
jgi:hypothetical protein